MLIRSENDRILGGAALAADPRDSGCARGPPSLLAGFCFLSAPEGRLGGLRLGTQGFA